MPANSPVEFNKMGYGDMSVHPDLPLQAGVDQMVAAIHDAVKVARESTPEGVSPLLVYLAGVSAWWSGPGFDAAAAFRRWSTRMQHSEVEAEVLICRIEVVFRLAVASGVRGAPLSSDVVEGLLIRALEAE